MPVCLYFCYNQYMKHQVLIIHGGTPFPSYKKYIDNLKSKTLELEKLKYRLDWKDSITAELGDKYEVLVPRMPNGNNAKYVEWKILFEKIIPFLKNNAILVGHSLGGIFLAKYLSENIINKKINYVILVSAPYRDLEIEDLSDFALPKSLSKFNKQIKNIILIHSDDDPIVPVDHMYKYNKELSNSKTILLHGMGHFKQEYFPELVEIIKTM